MNRSATRHGDGWLIEIGGRRYTVTEVGTDHEPVPPVLSAVVGPVILLAPLVVGLVAGVAAILQPDRVMVLITAAALLSSVVAAVAASMLFGATLTHRDRNRVAWEPAETRGPGERHLHSVMMPALERGPR